MLLPPPLHCRCCCTHTSPTEMISDATVGDLLLEELLQPASTGSSTADLNCVVDGFPRTAVQVRRHCLGLCVYVPCSTGTAWGCAAG